MRLTLAIPFKLISSAETVRHLSDFIVTDSVYGLDGTELGSVIYFQPGGQTWWIILPTNQSCAEAVVQSISANVQQMNIPRFGTRLNAKLLNITSDISSLHTHDACENVRAFVNQVKAQTGDRKPITTMNSSALQSAAASLKYVLGCVPGDDRDDRHDRDDKHESDR